MAGLSDHKIALAVRDLVRSFAREEIHRLRPQYRYATVDSVDHDAGTCEVIYPGDTVAVTVNMGAAIRPAVGQTVRVDGIFGDRFVSDVLTPAASTAYTPTHSNITVGSGSQVAVYHLDGARWCDVSYQFTLGSGSAFGVWPSVGLPFPAAAGRSQLLKVVYVEVGVAYHQGSALISAGATSAILLHNGTGNGGIVSSTHPFTWNGADADQVIVSGRYEIA